jgi:hypothetical protein
MPEGMMGRTDTAGASPRRTRGRVAADRLSPSRVPRALRVAALLLVCPAASAAAVLPQESRFQAYANESAFDALAESAGIKETGAFPFDFQFLAFKTGTPDSVEVWTAASVHAGRVRGVFDRGWRYQLSVGIELLRDDSVVVADTHRLTYVLSAEVPEWVSDGFPLQTMVLVEPGEYEFRLVVQDLNWPDDRSVNVRNGRVTIPAFDVSRPVISSVAIAADSGGTWSPMEDLSLQLNAAAIVGRRARPFVYYEVYGLTPGGAYRGEVRLASTWVSRGQGERFTGSYQPFQMQYRGTAPADPTQPLRAVMRVDMEHTQPGPYEVQVRVTDMATGKRSEVRKARLKVREPDPRRPEVPIFEVQTVHEEGAGGR